MSTLAATLSSALDTRDATVRQWLARYRGETQFVFLTAAERQQLGERIKSLSINFGALAVDLLAERLRLIGFTVNGQPDLDLWERWQAMGMPDGAQQVMSEALAVGQSFCSVWADEDGQPIALPESATQCIIRRDPVSRRAVAGMKRWTADNRGHAVLYLPDRVSVLTTLASVTEGGSIPADGWQTVRTLPNPTGVVPLVDLTNPGNLTEVYGRSELAPLADLCDALQKVMLDALISSHETGTPRRWSTGVELETDDQGNAVDPWSGGTTTVQAEPPDARFGQFSASDLSGFNTLAGLIVRQIGALSGLSPQMLGLHADSAMSADAIRAAEASLVSKAEARQRTFGRAWAQVGALLVAIRDGSDPRWIKVQPIWADPATRSEAQAADAAVKLHADGLLTREGTLERLGMGPDAIATEQRRQATDAAMRLAEAS
jgi:hypothetical protein